MRYYSLFFEEKYCLKWEVHFLRMHQIPARDTAAKKHRVPESLLQRSVVIKSNFTVIKCTQSIFDICGYCVYIVQESFLMSVLDTQCQLLYALSPEAKNNICPPCPQNCKMSHMVEGRQFCWRLNFASEAKNNIYYLLCPPLPSHLSGGYVWQNDDHHQCK